jgi:hypothetical protein
MAEQVGNHMKTGGEQVECQKRVVASKVDDLCAQVLNFFIISDLFMAYLFQNVGVDVICVS